MKVKNGYVQGFNAQAIATVDQWVVAAEVTNQANDAEAFIPMVAAAKANLRRAGERRRVRMVVADAGYWSVDNVNWGGVRLNDVLASAEPLPSARPKLCDLIPLLFVAVYELCAGSIWIVTRPPLASVIKPS